MPLNLVVNNGLKIRSTISCRRCAARRGRHEFGADCIADGRVEDAIDLRLGGGINMPPAHLVDREQLAGVARAPQRRRDALVEASSEPARRMTCLRELRRSAVTQRGCSAVPMRAANHAAKISAHEVGILVGQDIGLHIAESGIRLMFDPLVEGLDGVFLEMGRTGISGDHGLALSVGKLESTSISTPAVSRAITGSMCTGMPGVVCSAIAVQTRSMLLCAMSCDLKKARAALAPSTSKRSVWLLC